VGMAESCPFTAGHVYSLEWGVDGTTRTLP
jgi:hypothetical protein